MLISNSLLNLYKNVQCNELTLPFSRSLIKQNCISIECHNNKDYVGICVTTEGSIRYWPSIFNEYLCVDAKIELQNNDESAHLLYIAVISSNLLNIFREKSQKQIPHRLKCKFKLIFLS